MKSPLVTIVTPAYNKTYYFEQTIKSVLSQTFKDFEYMILDNSTDTATKEMIRGFAKKDTRIRLIEKSFSLAKRKKYYIPALLCNEYYPKAKGKYLIFLADDDLLLPTCLEEMIHFLQKNAQASVAYHDQFIVYELGEKAVWEPGVRGAGTVLQFPKNNPYSLLDGGQIMISKCVLKTIQQPFFSTDWEHANWCDKSFMEKLWRKYTFYPVNNALSIKRVVRESTFKNKYSLQFTLYYLGVRFIPDWIQLFLGKRSHKRRPLTSHEKKVIKTLRKTIR